MRWSARLGGIFALAWLVLLWPELGPFFHLSSVLHLQLPAPQSAALVGALVLYAALYAYYCFWGYRRREPKFVIALVASLSLFSLAINELSTIRTANPYLIPLMVTGFGFRPRPAAIAIGVLSVLAIVEPLLGAGLSPQETAAEIGLLLPQLLLFALAAMGLRYLLDVQSELRAARSQSARLAVEEERARISRDLHDLLGHSLSLITVKGELASRLVPPGEPGGGEVREIVQLAREALREVRETVSGYRQPTIAAELSAARTALQAAGIRLDVEQSVGAVSRETETVLGWAIREGVTNVIRHSGAAHCSIVLARVDGLVRADIVDDGAGTVSSDGGSGLNGLTERVNAIGGRLEVGRLPARGFKLSITAPVAGR